MGELSHAKSYRDLVVYQKSRQAAKEIFFLTKRWPKDENFSLTSQIRRSSRSVGAQIAEAWAKRKYEKHFISKLTDADGEQQETQHWLETASDCEYLTDKELKHLLSLLDEVGRMLNSMIGKSNLFCSSPEKGYVKEETALYFTQAPIINNEPTDN